MDYRDKNIDCLKGILIIFVVVGHVLASLNLKIVNYIYLFHMPAFMILSGMCYKKFNFKKTLTKTFVPFFAYMVLIYIYSMLLLYTLPLKSLVIGGSSLGGVFGVFWFIPCLFYAKVLFGLINNLKIKNIYKTIFNIILYVINIFIIKYFTYNKIIFWNVDIAFICLLYYYLGYYISNIKYNKYLVIFSLFMVMIISILWNHDILNIVFNMKNKSLFYNPIIQIIFPFCITIVFLKILSFISDHTIVKKVLSYIGKSSIVIMYLHIPIFNTLVKFFDAGYLLQIIISIFICMGFYYLFNKSDKIKKLFIG